MSSHYSDYDSNEESDAEKNSEEVGLGSMIEHHISATIAYGSFATLGTIDEFVLPGISVEHVACARMPLSSEDAQSLVCASRQAPFGRGGETIVDTSVRNTWELPGSAVRFLNPRWEDCLNGIVGKVAKEIGIAGGTRTVRAEFYKMLLYTEESMFKAHQEYVCVRTRQRTVLTSPAQKKREAWLELW